jgi:uncharacterized protein (DUF924 family)
MAETPDTVLDFWFGKALEDPAALDVQMKFWFGGGPAADKVIADRFTETVGRLSQGEARSWAAQGPRQRLAAVIGLDQFPRSIFRKTPASFECDPLARDLTHEAVASGEDMKLRAVERWFLYMPLEHSEASADQSLSVAKFRELLDVAPPEQHKQLESVYDYALRHADVIKRFGRFPHRNAILGRTTTPEEAEFLKTNPGF